MVMLLLLLNLQSMGVDFNKTNERGDTSAHLAARNGHVAVIAELAKHGVNFNKANRSGDTQAHLAAQNGHAAVITELAKNNVNVHQQNEHGSTLAHIAALNGHAVVIAELAKHQVDFNKKTSMVLLRLIWQPETGMLLLLLSLRSIRLISIKQIMMALPRLISQH